MLGTDEKWATLEEGRIFKITLRRWVNWRQKILRIKSLILKSFEKYEAGWKEIWRNIKIARISKKK